MIAYKAEKRSGLPKKRFLKDKIKSVEKHLIYPKEGCGKTLHKINK